MIVIFFPSSKESHNSTYFFFTNPITLMMNKLFICVCTQKFLQRENTADVSCQEFRYCFSSWWQNGPLAMYFFFFIFIHTYSRAGQLIKVFYGNVKKIISKSTSRWCCSIIFFSYNILPHIVKAFWNKLTFFISFSPMYNVCFVVFSMCVHYKSWIGAVWTSE